MFYNFIKIKQKYKINKKENGDIVICGGGGSWSLISLLSMKERRIIDTINIKKRWVVFCVHFMKIIKIKIQNRI